MNIKSNHQLWLDQYEEIQRSGLSIRSWAIQNNYQAVAFLSGFIDYDRWDLSLKAKHKLLDGVNVPVVVL